MFFCLSIWQAGNVSGQVIEMGLHSTQLLNSDKYPIVVPNSYFSNQVGSGVSCIVSWLFRGTLHWGMRTWFHWNLISLVENSKTDPLHFTLGAWGPQSPQKFEWMNKPAWSPTLHAMDNVSWSPRYFAKPTFKRWVEHKTGRPWLFNFHHPCFSVIYCVEGPTWIGQ